MNEANLELKTMACNTFKLDIFITQRALNIWWQLSSPSIPFGLKDVSRWLCQPYIVDCGAHQMVWHNPVASLACHLDKMAGAPPSLCLCGLSCCAVTHPFKHSLKFSFKFKSY